VQRTARGLRATVAGARARLRRSIRGDRPLLVVTLGVLALAAVLVSAPLQSYLDGQARVDHLTRTADALDRANAELEQRAGDLERDTTVELLAREQLGLVFPGEVAYTLAPPEIDEAAVPRAPVVPAEEEPWYARMWSAVRELIG
jgi:cell division protein FtsB